MRRVHGQPGPARAGQLRAAREVETLPGEEAHLAHQEEPRTRVHRRRERVHREVVPDGAHHPRLHSAIAQPRHGIHERRVLEVGEHGIVARPPVDGVHRLVQALRRVGEEGHTRRGHSEPGRDAGLRPAVDAEDLVAPRHAAALELAEAAARRVVRAEPRRLAPRAEMGDPLQAHELGLRDQAHLTRGWPASGGR